MGDLGGWQELAGMPLCFLGEGAPEVGGGVPWENKL